MPASPIRLMHFADVHFGVENYGRYDPATGLSTRLIDFRKALIDAITLALQAEVEIAVFSGDAYKNRDPNQTHQREFAQCLRLLTSKGVPVVLLTGNHDIPNTKGRANAIEIFGALAGELLTVIDRPGTHVITTARGRSLQIAAIPYVSKSLVLARDDSAGKGVAATVEAVVERYHQLIDFVADECKTHPDLPTVFLGHFTVASAKMSTVQSGYLTNEPEVSKSALARDEFDYVALGHIHRFQDLNRGQQPPIVYSGSIERIDFGERNETKGFVLVDVARGSAEYKFVELATRPFLEIEVDTTRGTDDPTGKIIDALAKEDLENAVVKLIYKIKPEDEALLDERRIHAALSKAFIKIAARKELVRDEEQKASSTLTESLDPMQALTTYIEGREALRMRKDELLAFAMPLWEELLAEESLI